MLAVSISKTENDGSYFLKARNAADLETQINGIFDRFRTAYERYWQSGADPRTLATVFELRAPCILDDPSLLIVSRHYTFAVMCDRYSEDRKLVDLIAKPFGALKRGDG